MYSIYVKHANCLIIIVTESGIVASKSVTEKEARMIRGSTRRYLRAGKKEKGKMFDEFINVTGCSQRLVGVYRCMGKRPGACEWCCLLDTIALTLSPFGVRLG